MCAARHRSPRKEPRGQRDLSLPVQEWRLEVGAPDAGARLDEFLARRLRWRSRASWRRLIEGGRVELRPFKSAGPPVGRLRAGLRLRAGQEVVVRLDAPHVGAETAPAERATAEIPIVFEDDLLLAVSKPPHLNVYPTRRHRGGSLIQRVHARERRKDTPGGYPPTLCHRLDRETSGLVLFARSRAARAALSDQFEHRRVEKTYLAVVVGEPVEESGRIELPLGRDERSPVEIKTGVVASPAGRPAATRWRVARRLGGRALLEVTPETGRQHQIRVHLAALGHPLVGDKLYLGGDKLFLRWLAGEAAADELAALGLDRHALHAWRLTLDHPGSGERVTLEAPPPPDLVTLLAEPLSRSRVGSAPRAR